MPILLAIPARLPQLASYPETIKEQILHAIGPRMCVINYLSCVSVPIQVLERQITRNKTTQVLLLCEVLESPSHIRSHVKSLGVISFSLKAEKNKSFLINMHMHVIITIMKVRKRKTKRSDLSTLISVNSMYTSI